MHVHQSTALKRLSMTFQNAARSMTFKKGKKPLQIPRRTYAAPTTPLLLLWKVDPWRLNVTEAYKSSMWSFSYRAFKKECFCLAWLIYITLGNYLINHPITFLSFRRIAFKPFQMYSYPMFHEKSLLVYRHLSCCILSLAFGCRACS